MWDKRFSEPGFAYGTEPNSFLASVACRIPSGRVLCLAEGEGRNAVFLAGQGFKVTAVDTSTVGLAKAETLARERGVAIETVNADLAEFTIEPNSWQAIISIFCHLPPGLRTDLHSRCVEGLAPGGAFVLEGFTPRQLELGTGGPKSPDLLYEIETLSPDLEGLQFETAHEIERSLVEGKYHNGVAAVVQILAFK